MDGLDIYVAGKTTVNFVFDRYMSLKNNLKPTTKSNYLYMYDRFIFTGGRFLRFFLESGALIGEVLGLRWEDIRYEKRIISINHNLTYYPVGEDRASENHISTPKTQKPECVRFPCWIQ